jgi:CHAD domain-containing protein
MRSRSPAKPLTASPHRMIAHHMRRALKELDRVARHPEAGSVHDLRVALRRSRTMAAGIDELDSSNDARPVKKMTRKLFRRLGKLRDMHVMRSRLTKLREEDEPLRGKLLSHLRKRVKRFEAKASRALERFDRNRWKKLTRRMGRCANSVVSEGPETRRVAAASLEEALTAHRIALRSNSQADWHAVRAAWKRFRYITEGFLPSFYTRWADSLKQLQDALGEAHDLNVFGEYLRARAKLDAAKIERWRHGVARERAALLDSYREKMTGKKALWRVWRKQLEQPPAVAPERGDSTTGPALVTSSASPAKAARHAAA